MPLHVIVKSAALQPFINQDLPIEIDQTFDRAMVLCDAIFSRAQRTYEQSGGRESFEDCPLSKGSTSIAVFEDNISALIVKPLVDVTKSELTWIYEV